MTVHPDRSNFEENVKKCFMTIDALDSRGIHCEPKSRASFILYRNL